MMKCRHCAQPIDHVFVDLGLRPSANKFLTAAELDEIKRGKPEPKFPLKVLFCPRCGLVQLAEYRGPKEMFTPEYTYFSSYSGSWIDHARRYADMAAERFALGANSLVVEIASNDGYLLQYFVAKGIPCLGIDPARNAAEAARRKGVETLVDFFGTDLARRLARERGRADLIAGNNVLAHVPDINDFVQGLHVLLKDDGVVTLEFPHLARLVEGTQFDTIYDEHYFYFSLKTVRTVFARHGLAVFDVEKLPTHGGSLRVYGGRAEAVGRNPAPAIAQVIAEENTLG
ncbi:MAG: class I SAM-dependent methyltransferase, partial [Pseudomonadota bacterium]